MDPEEAKLINELMDQKIEAMKLSLIPHNCFTCGWFVLRKKPPRNKVCRHPGELNVKNGKCVSWTLQLDGSKRTSRLY